MPSTTTNTQFPGLPSSLAAVALIDAQTAADAGQMSVSWWHDRVRTGKAPAPVIREPRCTRWRLSDVCAYWQARAEQPDTEAAELVTAKAKSASLKARTPDAIAKAKATKAANAEARLRANARPSLAASRSVRGAA